MLHRIDTVLFDLDGTLTVPVIDFKALRDRLGVPLGFGSLVRALEGLPPEERAAKEAILLDAEHEAARRAQANLGARELVEWLHGRGMHTAVITRNHPDPVEATFAAIGLRFDVVLHRLSGYRNKPEPDMVIEALRRLKRGASSALMVGDFIDDVTAGRKAGTRTCFVTNGRTGDSGGADLVVTSLSELLDQFRAAMF